MEAAAVLHDDHGPARGTPLLPPPDRAIARYPILPGLCGAPHPVTAAPLPGTPARARVPIRARPAPLGVGPPCRSPHSPTFTIRTPVRQITCASADLPD